MASITFLPTLFLSLLLSLSHFPIPSLSDTGSVGINYGQVADNLPPPSKVVQLLNSQGLNRVKLYNTDSTVLTALSGSNITVTVALPNEQLSSAASAQSYTDSWVQSNIVPYYPKTPIEAIAVGNEVFLFALFNEDQKPGPTSERNYGLFYPNEGKVYNIPLTVEGLSNASSESTAANGTKTQVPTPEAGGDDESVSAATAGQTWCVANGQAGEEKLQKGLDYACGEGGADCRPIQLGATCYYPKTVVAHASYAFNSYYQKKERGAGTCDFGGAAYVVTQPPKFGTCEFPTGY